MHEGPASLKFSEYASGSREDGSEIGARDRSAGRAIELSNPETLAVGVGGFPGVILRPLQKPGSTLLVVPRPAALKAGEQGTRPLSIPFTRENWMYQPPFIQPPQRSIVRHGTPLELSFHTNNGSSVSMEARQKLISPIDLAVERFTLVPCEQ
jgi:hypothetical protein